MKRMRLRLRSTDFFVFLILFFCSTTEQTSAEVHRNSHSPTIGFVKREITSLSRAALYSPPEFEPAREAFEVFRNRLTQIASSIKGADTQILDAKTARVTWESLRKASVLIPGYLLPAPWWNSVWFHQALGLEQILSRIATASFSVSKTSGEILRDDLSIARHKLAAADLNWNLLTDQKQVYRLFLLMSQIDEKLSAVLANEFVDIIKVGEAYHLVQKARYLAPMLHNAKTSNFLIGEDLLASVLQMRPRPSFLPSEPTEFETLQIPITCWSDSISVVYGEAYAKKNLAAHCESISAQMRGLWAMSGALYKGFSLGSYQNISPWGRGGSIIPMVFDYLLTVQGALKIIIPAGTTIGKQGPIVQGKMFEWDKKYINASPNITSAFNSWFHNCSEALWHLQREFGNRWIAGTCETPSFSNGANYWKKSQLSSQIAFWYRRD